ncbi:MAG: hypothetical protein SFT91_05010 [Rickettsiaceae bacterium]|nr:hypothetical protein [Rickettsiaceae bacterium]
MSKVKIFIISILFSASIIFAFGCALIYRLKSISITEIHSLISKEISSATLIDVEVGSVSVVITPYPRLRIEKLSSKDLAHSAQGLEANFINIYPKLYPLIMGKVEVNALEISELNLKNYGGDFCINSLNKLTSLISKANSKIDTLKIENLWDISGVKRRLIGKVHVVKSERDVHYALYIGQNIHFTSDSKYNLANDNFLSTIKINSPNFDFTANHVFSGDKTKSGSFRINFKNFTKATKDMGLIYHIGLLDYIGTEKLVKVEGLIKGDDNYTIYDEIKITGDDIEAKGSLYVSCDEKNQNIFNLQISKLNLSSHTSSYQQNLQSNEKPLYFDNLANLKLSITGGNIALPNGLIKSLAIEGEGTREALKIKYLYGNFEDGGKLGMWGFVYGDNDRQKFEGAFEFSGKNLNRDLSFLYNFSDSKDNVSSFFVDGNIKLTQRDIMISNFNLTTEGQNVKGDLDLKLIGKDKMLIGQLLLNSVDAQITKLTIVKNLYNYLKSLITDTRDTEYNSKFVALRNFPLKTHIRLDFNDLKIEDHPIGRFNAIFGYDHGQLKLEDYFFKNGTSYILGDAKIVSSSIKPAFYWNITDGVLDIPTETDNINKLIGFLNQNIGSTSFDMYSSGKLESVKLGMVSINKIAWYLDNKNGTFALNDGAFSLLGGSGTLSANFAFNPTKLIASIALEKFDLAEVNKYTGSNFFISKGLSSANAQISSAGGTYEELVKNLNIGGAFLGKDLVWQNLNIPSLLKKISRNDLDQEIIQKSVSETINSGSTIIENASGKYEYYNDNILFSSIKGTSKLFSLESKGSYNVSSNYINLKSTFTFIPNITQRSDVLDSMKIELDMIAQGPPTSLYKNLTFQDPNDINRIRRMIPDSQTNDTQQ